MSPAWPRSYCLIIKAANKAAANTKYALIDPDVGGDKTFEYVPLALASNPTGAVVAYMTITKATLAMVQKYADHAQDLIDAGHLAVYRLDNGAWTVASALADTTKKTHALAQKQGA